MGLIARGRPPRVDIPRFLARVASSLGVRDGAQRLSIGHNLRTAAEPLIDVMAFLEPRLKESSVQHSARATDMMVGNATSEMVRIA